jgi:MFS family permease
VKVAPGDEKLWRYASVARLWSWSLIAAAGALFALAIALRAGVDEGLDGRWFATVLGVTGITGAILFPLFRVWLRKSALPSVRLPDAVRATGPRRLEASPRDWRRWAILTNLFLVVGGFAMLVFLVGVLGGGGTAEGVVVGMLAAWGAATLEDARRIRQIEAHEGRRYYAARRRPTGVGNRLVWVRAQEAAAPVSERGV